MGKSCPELTRCGSARAKPELPASAHGPAGLYALTPLEVLTPWLMVQLAAQRVLPLLALPLQQTPMYACVTCCIAAQ